jgi:hypothetical protein
MFISAVLLHQVTSSLQSARVQKVGTSRLNPNLAALLCGLYLLDTYFKLIHHLLPSLGNSLNMLK